MAGQSFSITVTPVDNDAPVQVNNTGSTVLESGTDSIISTELLFTDSEQPATSVTYTVTGGPSNGQLELTTGPGVAVTSFTQEDIDNNRLVYVHDGSNTISDSFNFSVDDGQGNTLAGQSFSITVTPVDNDAPVVVNNTGSTVVEGGTDTLITAKLLFTDSEQPATNVTYTVTGGRANGQLELTTGPGVAVTSFTQEDIDNNRLVYVHDGSNTISDSFNFSVDDGQGNTLAGQSFSITVTPVDNDAPVVVNNTGSTVNEGGTDTISNSELRYNDTEQPVASLTYTVTVVPSNGQLEVTTNPGIAITSFTQSQVNAGWVVYVHDGSNTTTDSFTFSIDDGQGNAVTGQTFNLTITPTNDTPTTTGIANVTVTEDAPDMVIDLFAAFADAEDADAALTYTVTNNTNPALFTSTAIDGAAGTLTLDYAPSANGTADITVRATDTGGLWVETTFTVTVNAVNDAPVGLVTIDNITPAVGDTLTASNTLADADGLSGPISYQWYLDGVALGGATGNTYTVVPADVGGVITVVASYTDDQGTFESVSSAPTAAVTNVNNAPVIGGGSAGAVTEDVDPDSDGLLEVGGVLSISDPDAGESNFQAGTVVGSYGSLTIDAAGTWNYAADNTQAAIQRLNAGESVTDVLAVTTADGTTHNVTITINGAADSPLVDDSPGPVDEGGTDPDPEDDVDPVEPEPDEVLPVEEVLPASEENQVQAPLTSKTPSTTPSQLTPPRHFVPTFALRTPENAYRNANVSPSITARYLSSIKQEPTNGSHESRIEGNFVSAATVYFSPEIMAQALDHLQRQIDDTLELEANQGQLIIGAAAGFGTTVMVGYVVWAFRGASLAAWRPVGNAHVAVFRSITRSDRERQKAGRRR